MGKWEPGPEASLLQATIVDDAARTCDFDFFFSIGEIIMREMRELIVRESMIVNGRSRALIHVDGRIGGI
jgi:hypothetical protein